MKNKVTNSIKIIFSALILLGSIFESSAQCPSCPGGSTIISSSNYSINSSGNYCITSTVSNLTINASNVLITNQGTINGTVSFWGGSSTFNNCGTMNLTGPLQIPNSSSLHNYGTLNSTSSVTNNGGALDVKAGSSMTISQLVVNSGIMYIGGNVTTTFTGNYATTNYGNITGTGGTLTTSTFLHTGSLNGNLSLTHGEPTAGSGYIAPTIQFYSCSSINKSGSWLQRASLTTGSRETPLVFSFKDKVYVGLGVNGQTPYTDLHVYNTKTNSWSQVATTFPNPQSTRIHGQARIIGNKAYFATLNNCQTNLWEYDIVANTWALKASPPFVGRDAFTFVQNNKYYAGAGYTYCDKSRAISDVFEYNPATNTWVTKSMAPVAGGFVVFENNGKGYIAGGYTWGPAYNYTREYNSTTDTWNTKLDFPWETDASGYGYGLAHSTAYGACNYGFIYYAYDKWIGNSTVTTNQVLRFNSTSSGTGAWSSLTAFPGTPRLDANFVMVYGKGYLFGGGYYNNGQYVANNELWLFNPNSGSVVSPRTDVNPDMPNGSITESANSVTLAPNPAESFTDITFRSTYENAVLKVYSAANAAAVHQEVLTAKEGTVKFNTGSLENGVYLCIIQSGDVVIGKQRLVIAR